MSSKAGRKLVQMALSGGMKPSSVRARKLDPPGSLDLDDFALSRPLCDVLFMVKMERGGR